MKTDAARLMLIALGLAAGCVQPVHLGSDGEEPTRGCEGPPASMTCPGGTGGPTMSFVTADEVQLALRGRWVFCGGERRATGRGQLSTFFGGAGVQFSQEGGELRYGFLLETAAGYAPRTEPWFQGRVRVELAGRLSRLVLVADDGVETPWTIELFGEQRVLRNSSFDQWDFVAID